MKKLLTIILTIILFTMPLSATTLNQPLIILTINNHMVKVLDGCELATYYQESTKGLYVSQAVYDIDGVLTPVCQKVVGIKNQLITIQSGDNFYTTFKNHFKIGDTIVIIKNYEGEYDIVKCNIQS